MLVVSEQHTPHDFPLMDAEVVIPPICSQSNERTVGQSSPPLHADKTKLKSSFSPGPVREASNVFETRENLRTLPWEASAESEVRPAPGPESERVSPPVTCAVPERDRAPASPAPWELPAVQELREVLAGCSPRVNDSLSAATRQDYDPPSTEELEFPEILEPRHAVRRPATSPSDCLMARPSPLSQSPGHDPSNGTGHFLQGPRSRANLLEASPACLRPVALRPEIDGFKPVGEQPVIARRTPSFTSTAESLGGEDGYPQKIFSTPLTDQRCLKLQDAAGSLAPSFGPCAKVDLLSGLKVGTPLSLPTVMVRLARSRDLAPSGRSTAPAVTSSKEAANPLDYTLLRRELHCQRALDFGLHSDLMALSWWYFPYAVLSLSYMLTLALTDAVYEVALLTLPLLFVLFGLHLVRLLWCDRRLYMAIDKSAIDAARAQLRAPMCPVVDGRFAASLSAALQALREPPPLLVTSSRRRLPRGPVVGLTLLVLLLSLVRLLRSAMDAPWFEAGVATMAAAVFTFVATAPSGVQGRALEADSRLTKLEAAFNSMVDTLRPLLKETPTSGVLGLASLDASKTLCPARDRFCVRLVTAERRVLRALVCLSPTKSPETLCVLCPLADVCISIGSLGGVHVAELGRSAAGCLELPVQSGPTSILPGTSPFSAMGGFGHSPRGQRHTDDDLFSQSTASTLRTRGPHGTQQDDAALHLAMSMVATVCSRHRRPLDAFMVTSGVSSTALPPKIEADEPSLLLTVALDHMSLSSCLHLPGASAPAHCTGRVQHMIKNVFGEGSILRFAVRCLGSAANEEIRDQFGVLHDPVELHRLCNATTARSRMGGTPATTASAFSPDRRHHAQMIETPRSSNASSAECDVYPPVTGKSCCKHLAVVFDTVDERDRCLAFLREMHQLGDDGNPLCP